MSTETPNKTTATPATTTPVPAPVPAAPAQDPTDWKAEARKWEDRAKENRGAADELAALKAAQMTDAEKTAARLSELEATVKGYEAKEQVAAWKAQVAETTGVPAVALAGSSLEEIQAHAETLKPLIAAAQQPTTKPHPVPGITQTPQAPANVPLRDQIAAAEAAGNKELVGTLKAMLLGQS